MRLLVHPPSPATGKNRSRTYYSMYSSLWAIVTAFSIIVPVQLLYRSLWIHSELFVDEQMRFVDKQMLSHTERTDYYPVSTTNHSLAHSFVWPGCIPHPIQTNHWDSNSNPVARYITGCSFHTTKPSYSWCNGSTGMIRRALMLVQQNIKYLPCPIQQTDMCESQKVQQARHRHAGDLLLYRSVASRVAPQ